MGSDRMPFTLMSDIRGSFRLFHIPNESVVELSARHEKLETSQALTVKLTDGIRPQLVLVEKPTMDFAGQVIDEFGNGIARALVNVRYPETLDAEAYNGELRVAKKLVFITDYH